MQRMLPLALALGAAVGLLACGGAYAAPAGGMGGAPGGGMGRGMPAGPGPSTGTMPDMQGRTEPGASATSGLKPGMTVKDSAGVAVGKITKVGRSGGAAAALVDVGGKTVVVMGSTLTVSGDTATSTQTSEQIKALPEPKPS